jgi:hypothetical protein
MQIFLFVLVVLFKFVKSDKQCKNKFTLKLLMDAQSKTSNKSKSQKNANNPKGYQKIACSAAVHFFGLFGIFIFQCL